MAGDVHHLADKLRQQRDRFIAFAFAGADLLLEIDSEVIVYAAGAGESLYGLSDAVMVGRPLADFVVLRDRPRLEEALQRLRNSGRLDNVPVSLMGDSGAVTRMRLAGIHLPQFKHYHLVLARIPPLAADGGASRATPVEAKARFVDMVRQRLNDANRSGHEVMLTLVDLPESGLEGMEPAKAQSLVATLHHLLDEMSVDGASAGMLAERSFGVVHRHDLPPQAVRDHLRALSSRFPSEAGLKFRSTSLQMEDSGLTNDDIGKAVNFIVNSFVRDSSDFAIASLAEGAQAADDDTLTRVRNFRRLVKAERMSFVYQPAVNLRTGAVLCYETFTRLNHNNGQFLPAQILPFATDSGVIGEFDLAVCRKILAIMRAAEDISPLAHVTINIAALSMTNPIFYRALLILLQENKALANRLILEVTNVTDFDNLDEARRLLARLRTMGVRISVDDFGAGGAAFDLLRALPADYAKMDRTYVQGATDAKGIAVLKAMAGLCHDLGIVSIANCVEDPAMLVTLRDIGIDYAQGHVFGLPAADTAKKNRYYAAEVAAAGSAQPVLVTA